jgi:hypothetical protein
MKKLRTVFALVAVLMLSFPGCGPGEYKDPGTTPGVTEEGVPPIDGDDSAGESADAGN